jgi:hypothetical protein
VASGRLAAAPARVQVDRPRTSAWAIVSVCLCFVAPAVGALAGYSALVRINRSEGRLGGRGLALFSICAGAGVTVLFVLVMVAGMAFGWSRPAPQPTPPAPQAVAVPLTEYQQYSAEPGVPQSAYGTGSGVPPSGYGQPAPNAVSTTSGE